MALKPTYRIGDPINAGTFRKYIEHFYNGHLRLADENFLKDGGGAIQRPTFVAVAHSLLATGNFKTGERFRLSQVAIADISGTSPKTVRRVLALLEKTGAIHVVGKSKRPGGGKPVKVYTLTYSEHVRDVLRDEDRNKLGERWKRPKRLKKTDDDGRSNPTAIGAPTPFNGHTNPIEWVPQPHNRNHQEQEKNGEEESSPAPIVAMPPARDGAAVVDEEYENDSAWLSDPGLDLLLADL
jgi:hypothetical protein